MLTLLRTPMLDPLPHGFLGRTGGVSGGIFESLNVGLGSSDDARAVEQNRARAMEAVAPGCRLVTLHQIHSARCVVAQASTDAARAHADALVTNQKGLVLGVLTADCAPVLLADATAGVVGAAHAGWKGALTGVIGATVEAMVRLGARAHHISACIGPCIAQRSYEVDAGFVERFMMQDADSERFFMSGSRMAHYQFDLEGYVACRLARAGVQAVALMGADTYSQPTRFFSYRRSTHAQEADYGRQISLIALG
jgi:YfiH family protein